MSSLIYSDCRVKQESIGWNAMHSITPMSSLTFLSANLVRRASLQRRILRLLRAVDQSYDDCKTPMKTPTDDFEGVIVDE
jgi:hypothetical protein